MKHPFLVLCLTTLLASAAVAHHNWAAGYFTTDPEVEIAGVISKVEWRNPHVRMEVTVDAGKPTEKVWELQSSSVAQLTRMDVTPDLVKVGQAIKVAGYAGRQDPNSIYMNHLLLPSGTELIFLRDAAPRWPGKHLGDTTKLGGTVIEKDINKRPATIFAVWNTVYGDPKSHGLSAQRAAAASDKEANKPPPPPATNLAPSDANYCAAKALPGAMGNPYPIQFIKESNDKIVLKLEEYDQVRTIHMTSKHDDTGVAPSLMGYSSGVWQGTGEKKLVVTTTKIDSNQAGSSARLTETFELSADRNDLNYTTSFVDPSKPGAPAVTSKYWRYKPGATVQPYNCTA